MLCAFDKISKIWETFPTKFKYSTLYDEVIKLKTSFQEERYICYDYLTKIVIIGKVSTGKSTLINALLDKEYFDTVSVSTTPSFFYCSLSEKNYEYFTLNNCPIEHKQIETLKNALGLNIGLKDYIDQNSVIKTYLKRDENRILERKTVIVDCPGFGHDDAYDKEIENHCSNADMFIFMFQINDPATLKQSILIKKIRDNNKNLSCFFVYNKCDSPDFNENLKRDLSNSFIELFGEQCVMNLIVNFDPLYFISTKFPDRYEDFARLKQNIMVHKDVKFLQYTNVLSKLSDNINMFGEKLSAFRSNERHKISPLKRIIEMKSQIHRYVNRHIDICKNNILLDKIFDIMLAEIYDCDGICNKQTAPILICKIEENIKRKVNEFVENHLKNSCIDPINRKLQEIRNDTNTNIIINDIDLRVSTDHLIIPIYRNIDIFYWFEFGDKTNKVKKSYAEFIQSDANKKQIYDSIKNLYNTEFSKIEAYIENFLDDSSENLRILEDNLEILLNYQKEFYDYKERYNSSCP